MLEAESDRVASRRVFYIPGYDPFPPRRYRELYRTESAEQAKISGYTIALNPTDEPTSWSVTGVIAGRRATALCEVLVWSDIVQRSMSGGVLASYAQLVRTAWVYISTGALRRLMWLRKGPVLAALYPIGMLLAQLGVALALGGLAANLLSAGLDGLASRIWAQPPIWTETLSSALWVAAGAAVVWFCLMRFYRLDGKLFAHYLMHDFAFAARWKGANPPELETRITEFSARIEDALDSGADEVLVVGHSSGAHLAISALADLLKRRDLSQHPCRLGFLSLGHVVPMMSFLPEATKLRTDLHDLAARAEVTWIDISAPGDGCSFALCDPVSVTGVEPRGKRWPLVLSAAFSKTLSDEKRRALRWRFFRLHFQYLCAFDQPGAYDYFQITAGPMTLASRFRDRSPSRSRIDVAASKYRNIA
ncbi:MAG: hypothetical protein AAGA12_13315 [Pseudomonadota bacterium]